MNNFLIIINGMLNNQLSGGDDHNIEVARRWRKKTNLTFLTSKFAGNLIKKNKDVSRINFISSDNVFKTVNNIFGIIFVYLYRIITSLFKKFENDFSVIISSSYFLCDVLASILVKKRTGNP